METHPPFVPVPPHWQPRRSGGFPTYTRASPRCCQSEELDNWVWPSPLGSTSLIPAAEKNGGNLHGLPCLSHSEVIWRQGHPIFFTRAHVQHVLSHSVNLRGRDAHCVLHLGCASTGGADHPASPPRSGPSYLDCHLRLPPRVRLLHGQASGARSHCLYSQLHRLRWTLSASPHNIEESLSYYLVLSCCWHFLLPRTPDLRARDRAEQVQCSLFSLSSLPRANAL